MNLLVITFVLLTSTLRVVVDCNKVRRRLASLEKRARALETRVSLEESHSADISEQVAILNATMTEIGEVCVGENRLANTRKTTGNADTDNTLAISVLNAEVRVMKAFKDEKARFKTTFDSLLKETTDINERCIKTELDVKELKAENMELKKANEQMKATVDELHNLVSNQTNTIYDLEEKQLEYAEEKLQALINPTDNVKHQQQKECPDSWDRYQNFCYKLFDERFDFGKARIHCAEHDAHVVDIQDMEEQNFVANISQGNMISIGLKYSEKEMSWKWDRTNATALFTNWYPGQANGFELERTRAVLILSNLDRNWYAVPCDVELLFVCKKPL